MERTRLLVCEDDVNLGLLLGEYFRARGYDAHVDVLPLLGQKVKRHKNN